MHYLKPRNIAISFAVFLFIFGLSIWMLKSLPGTSDLACVMGAYLTTGNIFINLFLSSFIALTVVNVIEISKNNTRYVPKSGLVGSALVMLTSFCAVCTLPILTSLGLSVVFTFISSNHGLFQVIAFALCLYALFSSHKQVKMECELCKI